MSEAYTNAGKRLFDLAVTIPALILFAPLMALIAVLVRINLGSPILFRQRRPGWHGEPFVLLKFRSMSDARDANQQLLPDAERLTRFGKLLRSTSLDELPELLNVMAGKMSVVGPRPLLMHYLPLYTAEEARRHEVKPGITGWSQVNGRNALSWEERLKLDVWYVDNLNFELDFRILILTLLKVVKREGVSADNHATMVEFIGSRSSGK